MDAAARPAEPAPSDVALSAAARAGPLPLGQKLAYSIGAFSESAISASLNIFLLFYVTTVCGLPGGLAGAALAAGLVVDAVADPLLGSISDSWRSRFGRRLPMMALGLPLMAAAFVAIFSLPAGLSQTALFLLLAALSIALRIAVSIFNLPYLALGAELSDDYAERASITTWRWGAATIGAVAAVVLGFVVFFKGDGGALNRAAYAPFALTLCLPILLFGLAAMAAVHATRARQHPVPAAGRFLARLAPELIEVFANRSFQVLFVSAFLMFTAQGAAAVLGLHANTFFWRFNGAQIQLVTLAYALGLVIGAPLTGPIVKRLERRTALLISGCGLMAMQAGPASLRLLGLLPLHGQALSTTIAVVMLLAGVMTTMAAIALISMLADAADEHEHLFGARREALYFAGWAFAGKAANGGGALIAGLVLQAIAFPSGAAAHAAGAVAPAAANWLGFFYGPGAAVLSAAGLAILLLYRLDHRAHAAIMGELAARRGLTGRTS
ncbi:MAG: major facilitator superfamily 1 [Caulobacter sp.]|nr:major facilitator superfamily 1 [Caulobacter sp.]